MASEKLLLVVDPIPCGFSVQYGLIESLTHFLKENYEITVFSNFVCKEKTEDLHRKGIEVLRKKSGRIQKFIKSKFYHSLNESFLWGVNWFLDLLSFKLGHEAKIQLPEGFDYVINLSSTVMCNTDVLWLQGPPFVEVVEEMAESNIIAKLFLKFFRTPLKNASQLSVIKMAGLSKNVVANSQFIASRYKKYPFQVGSVIYSSQELSGFEPSHKEITEKYVLTYVGKETELETVMELANLGIKIKAFGAKIPPGFNLGKLKNSLTFLGAVSKDELVTLYNNAYFVAFPFTSEPFGLIPIESMLSGVPVLSYNREGPSETILDGQTGWLVNTREEFIEKALSIWKKEDTGIKSNLCIERGKEFTAETAVMELNNLIKPLEIHEIASYT